MCKKMTYVWLQRGEGYVQQPVPCRHCWQCRENALRDWIGRCLCEADRSDWAFPVTLTYATQEDLSHRVLHPDHWQKFVRALRDEIIPGSTAKIKKRSVRYFVAGEYGSLKGRAHFHALLFGSGEPPTIIPHKWDSSRAYIPQWKKGHVNVDKYVTPKTVRYVAKYILKGTDINAETDNWFSVSKKPPLGASFFEDKASEAVAFSVMPSSFRYTPPGDDYQSKRRYMMTGATRRNYCRSVIRGLAGDDWQKIRASSDEWINRALDRVAKWEHLRAWEKLSPQVQGALIWEGFGAEQMRAPRLETALGKLFRNLPENVLTVSAESLSNEMRRLSAYRE